MARLPWNEVPQEDVCAPGFYALDCVALEKRYAESGKLMYNAQFRFREENPNYAGKMLFNNFVLGTDDDPDPTDLNPDVFGVKMLVRLFRAMSLPPTDELDQALDDAINKGFIARISVREQKDGEYAGRKQEQFNEFFPLGSKELGPTEPKKKATATATRRRNESSNNASSNSHEVEADEPVAASSRRRREADLED